MQFTIIFALLVAIIAVMFALQNPTPVVLHLIAWDIEKPLALFMLVALALGAIMISILSVPAWFRAQKIKKNHNKEISELEDSLSKYRSNLIDAQNSNKDLRQKLIELEESRSALEKAQTKAEEEISDLHEALAKADLTTQEAEQAKAEALEAREQMDQALKSLELYIAEAAESAQECEEVIRDSDQKPAGDEKAEPVIPAENETEAVNETDEEFVENNDESDPEEA